MYLYKLFNLKINTSHLDIFRAPLKPMYVCMKVVYVSASLLLLSSTKYGCMLYFRYVMPFF